MQNEPCLFPARPPGSAFPVVTALRHQSAWATICTDHIKPVFPVYMVRRGPRVTGLPYPNIASSNALIWLHLCHLPRAWTLCTLPSGASEARHPWNPSSSLHFLIPTETSLTTLLPQHFQITVTLSSLSSQALFSQHFKDFLFLSYSYYVSLCSFLQVSSARILEFLRFVGL